MKHLIIIVLFILGNMNHVLACECNLYSIVEELELSDEIVIGQVVHKNKNEYEIRIIKEFRKKQSFKAEDKILIVQGITSCTKRSFELNKVYLFYMQNRTVHNCSRTIEFSKTKDLECLSSDKSLKAVFYGTEKEFEELKYLRKYSIIDVTNTRIITKDKSVVYIYKRKIISKNAIPEDRNLFYPIRYYLINEVEIDNVDLIFYIDDSHQERIGEPKLSKRIIKKINKVYI